MPVRLNGLPGKTFFGVLGAGVIVLPSLLLRMHGPAAVLPFPADAFGSWALVVGAVAVTEELLLRGALFSTVEATFGPLLAMAVTSVAFALLHLPLYGPAVLPIDLAVGVWLGGLRLLSGGVMAPAVAHALADLAGWWTL